MTDELVFDVVGVVLRVGGAVDQAVNVILLAAAVGVALLVAGAIGMLRSRRAGRAFDEVLPDQVLVEVVPDAAP